MVRIFDIALKDMLQILRDRKTFLFLLLMPLVFTLLFGYAFGGFGGNDSDPRLPVGFLDADRSRASQKLHAILAASEVVRLDEYPANQQAELENQVNQKKLVAAIFVPAGYGHALLEGRSVKLVLLADTSSAAGTTAKSAALSAASRLDGAARTALVMEGVYGETIPFDYVFDQALAAWDKPPIGVTETTSSLIKQQDDGNGSLAHTSPGMMLQFAIAGLLTSAQMIVTERKSRALQRLLTTATRRSQILLGHYLAIVLITFSQFVLLIFFGQLVLKVNYFNNPPATFLVAVCAALCIGALGLLIGIFARTEEQAIIFALIPMFVFAGLGGAWVPLEMTGATFQTIGHVSPIAWAMDGFKNISVRGLGMPSVLLPCLALLGYAVLFFGLAAWRLARAEEQ